MIDDDPPEDESGVEDEQPNAADPIQFKRAVDRQRKVKETAADWWRKGLSSETGRAEIWSLISEFFLAQPFAVGPNGFPQPEATWFQTGQREKAFILYHKLLAIDRDGVMRMLDEHHPTFAKPIKRRRKTED